MTPDKAAVAALKWTRDENGNLGAACCLGIYWFADGVMWANGSKIFSNGEMHYGVWEVYRGEAEPAMEAAQINFASRILSALDPAFLARIEALDRLIAAWDSLPEGNYSPTTVERWLVNEMAPAIKAARTLGGPDAG